MSASTTRKNTMFVLYVQEEKEITMEKKRIRRARSLIDHALEILKNSEWGWRRI